MLQAIREKVTGWIAYGIIFLISIPFALWGVNSYLGGGEIAPAAIVNGEEISVRELDQAYANYRQRLSQLFGGSIPENFANEEMLRETVRDQLIEQAALRQYIERERYRIDDDDLNRMIRGMDVFQRDGQFDTAIYEAQVRSLGYSPLGFEQELRINGAMQQFEAGIRATAFVTPQTRERFNKLNSQTRKLRSLRLGADDASIEIDDDAIEQRYESRSELYMSPDQVRIDYIEVSLEDVKQAVQVNAGELRQRYEDNLGAYSTPEKREASHILIKVGDADDSDEKLAQIREIRERIVAGESFADLAREFSEDPGSAADGGSLGEIERGFMVQTFETALFSMEVDQLSEPVKTGFGWHLIKLHSISGGETRDFESVRAELEDELRTELAESQIFDLIENLANLAYEQSDSLQPAAEQLGLALETSDWFSRNAGQGIAAERQVRQLAFSPEVLQQGLNSEAIELGNDRVVFIRLNEYRPAERQSLEQVRERIVGELKAEKLRERNSERGAEALASLSDGKTLDDLAADIGAEIEDHGFVSRQQADVDASIRERAFKMPKPEQSAVYDGLSLPGGDYVIVEMSAVMSNDAEGDQQALGNLVEAYRGAEYQAATKMLSTQAEVVKTPLEDI